MNTKQLFKGFLALGLLGGASSLLAPTEAFAQGSATVGSLRGVLKDKPNAPQMPDAPSDDQQQAAIEAALELAYAERPARDKVVADAKQALADATAFVREKDLVTVPNDPVKVILMPEFQRGVAVAYCDSPGPLDKGLDTYFAISPIPDDWSKEQSDSFLREYSCSRSTRRCRAITWKARTRRSSRRPCVRCCVRACSPKAGRSIPSG